MSIHIWIHLSVQGKSWGEVPLVHWVGQWNVITKPVSVANSWGFFCHPVFYWTQRHFDYFLLPTFLTRIHFVCGTKRRAECLHPQKACDICERTLECGQAELKTADWHASTLHVVTNTQACGGRRLTFDRCSQAMAAWSSGAPCCYWLSCEKVVMMMTTKSTMMKMMMHWSGK